MRRAYVWPLLLGFLTLTATLGASPAMAAGDHRSFAVTITNLTAHQVVTPPLLVTHDPKLSLFEPGESAGDGLTMLAETGDPSALAGELEMAAGVADVTTGMDVIPPGESMTLKIDTWGGAKHLSFAAMLALTNDAFAAVRGLELPWRIGQRVSVRAVAYDAGSEANLETAKTVPGLGGMDRATDGSEGFIHIHRGIHGGGDLDPGIYDWRNPVVELTVERVAP